MGGTDMASRVIVTEELNRIMGLLRRLLDVRITFFDQQQAEYTRFDMKPMSSYCAARRKNRAFNARCIQCDRSHLVTARETRDVHIYHCHNRLLEGIVPLYDRRNIYIGAVVFGQLRDPQEPEPADVSATQRRLYRRLASCTEERVRDIGTLLKWVSEYIIGNELIRYHNRVWADRLDASIEANLHRPPRLDQMAAVIGCSKSFVSHHFRTEFGLSPRQHIQKRRLEEARVMLENGETVQRTAERLGFYDAFHFSKAFKAHWGKPPKLFRH
jgi:AraC-like DNA-binding protein